MTIREAVRLYPKAIAWSILFSTAIAMEGFDLVLISSLFAFPPFTKKYGTIGKSGKYQIPAPWQAALSNGARIGEITGLLLNGILAERFGFKKTMVGTLAFLTALIFIPFFSQNLQTLLAADILMGIPWGVFQTLTCSYAAEVCPVVLRPYLTTYVNMMWGVGQLIASGVLRAMLSRTDQWAYRIPFALQWMWSVPLMVAISFAPESPWWLVRRGRVDEARTALKRLSMTSQDEMDNTISMMRHTDEVEKEISAGTSYWDCFKGVNLRRTEITSIVWIIQAASGASLMGYAAYFFQQAGLPTSISFDFSMSLYSVAIIGVAISWFAMNHLGRRTLYVGGLCAMVSAMLAVGFASIPTTKGSPFAIGSLLLVFTLCYDITVGTVAYSIVTEMPSSRLRTKTIVIGRALYNVQGIINGVITPYMLNPDSWNWKGKAGFFWAGTGLCCLVWAYFRLPEPKGRTYAEMDVLFEQKISARKFKIAVVDPFLLREDIDGKVELQEVEKK
ncbi:putative maltose permease [Melanomma pulvis-pyrius CBS 109.77]|uniref:Putative maltose permease n=1 Tax=Melanomma pulvis-pyrius CBS 109.77 TaxID=1314802 RepID=A0A6A6XNZ5_9PLEO|nr:putative maltose permease [Melanomma pulvis-pyrius CBS 109.77]